MNVVFILFFLFVAQTLSARDFLFRSGKSDYSIVLPPEATAIDKTAAKELQTYIAKVGGTHLPIVDNSSAPAIYLQEESGVEDAYCYYTSASSLYIKGYGGRGILYGVYAFLEEEMGIHWLTPDVTEIPTRRSFELGKCEGKGTPAFQYRLDYFYAPIRDNLWCAHNLLNTQVNVVENEYGNMEAWWGAHTFERLVPANEYFQLHPEYYSLYHGQRVPDGQLCLSNADVRHLLVQKLLRTIQKYPEYTIYDVSQNDNLKYCECENCSRIAKKYGGQSGLLLWFVNQVAEEVAKVYPEKRIGTLAYRYTRSLPVGIVPRENVAIRLCSFECCFCHGLDECERNEAFLADLKAWHSVTDNLHIWDYCVGFKQYVAPHPYFHALADRLREFREYGVKGVLELGEYDSPWGDFTELKQWVVAKLLWNPGLDVDSLAHVFIKSYYGKASSAIDEYYVLTQKIVNPSYHYKIYCDYKNASYTAAYIRRGRELVDEARRRAGRNALLLRRVNRIAAQIYYLQVMNSYPVARIDGTFQTLCDIIEQDPTYFMEHRQTMSDALHHWGYI